LASRQDYLSFYRREINLREASKFPPFSLIVRILYSGEKEKDCIEQLTKQFLRISELKKNNVDSFIYLDKMRCPVKRVEKKFRFQILMKLENTDSDRILQQIFTICDQKEYKDVSVFVETNPQNLA
jgi:primosomal protein N' (replication factor Y)